MQPTTKRRRGNGSPPSKQEELIALLAHDDAHAVGALLRLWSLQTDDEKSSRSAAYDNQVGFSGVDAGLLTSFAEQVQSKDWLSPKQMEYLHRMIQKYAGQLLRVGYSPRPIRTERIQSPAPRRRRDRTPEPEPALAKVRAELSPSGKDIDVLFNYDPDLVAAVKQIPGRQFHGHEKVWSVPLVEESVPSLRAHLPGIVLGPRLSAWIEERSRPAAQVPDTIPGLKVGLFPFQHEGVEFIEGRKGRAVVGDEMGLGKTIQALAWLQFHPELRPAIIVCPASLKLNWLAEALKVTDERPLVISGRPRPGDSISGHRVLIINYDILGDWSDRLTALSAKVLVLDECHYIKNRKADRTKASMLLGKQIPHVLALSGTPIINRPVEFFNSLHLVDPGRFRSFWDYAHRYCGAKHNGFGWDFTGASNTAELNALLVKTCMIRRLKADVLQELPAKTRALQPMSLDPAAMKTYKVASARFLEWLASVNPEKVSAAERAEALTKIEALKQLALKAKLDGAVDWIGNFLDCDGKLVVFATHKETIRVLRERFPEGSVVVDGSTSLPDRDVAVRRFQSDPDCRLLIGNLKAAGVGLTLTASSNTCFVELGWTPGEHDQAEDRVHRIGQKDAVTAWYLVAPGTIDEAILAMIDKKRKVLASVLDGRAVDGHSLLSVLLTEMQDGVKNRG